jgi:hypothetical protein
MSVLCPFIAASTSGVSPSPVVFQHQLFLLTSFELFPLAHILQPTVTLKFETIVCCVDIDSVKGRVVEDNINNNRQPWGGKGTLPY